MSESSSGGSSLTGRGHRIPLQSRVRLEFDRFQGFVEEYSSNISLGGMFIKSKDPKPPGTILEFELALAGEDFTFIRGMGEVVWVRHQDQGASRPPGMGIRFRELDPQSQALISRMVRIHLEEGGKAFELYPPDLESRGSAPENADSEEAKSQSQGPGEGKEAFRVPKLTEPRWKPRAEAKAEGESRPVTRSEERDSRQPPPVVHEHSTPRKAPVAEAEPQTVPNRQRRNGSRPLAVAAVLVLAGAATVVFLLQQPLASLISGKGETPAPDQSSEMPGEDGPVPPPAGELAAVEQEPVDQPLPQATAARAAPGESQLAPPATVIETIAWEESGGEFILRLRGNGPLAPERLRRFRLNGGNPRELIQVRGIERPYGQPILPVASPLVRRIRTGFHLHPTGPELHIVVDLARNDLPPVQVEIQGSETLLRFAAK